MKFQVSTNKLPTGPEGKVMYKAGQIVEAENMKDLAKKYPSLVGKVKRYEEPEEEPVLEVATPERKKPGPKPKA